MSDESFRGPVRRVETRTLEQGRVVYAVTADYGDSGELVRIAASDGMLNVYQYEQGRLVGVEMNGGRRHLRYDEAGRLIEESTIDAAGARLRWTRREYDDEGQTSRTEQRPRPDAVQRIEGVDYPAPNVATVVSRFDRLGRVERIDLFTPEEPFATFLFTRDGRGHLLEVRQVGGPAGAPLVRIFRRDDGGRMLEERVELGDALLRRIEQHFDDDGRLITVSEGSYVTRFRYDLNERGDWVRRWASNGDGEVVLVEREIVYR